MSIRSGALRRATVLRGIGAGVGLGLVAAGIGHGLPLQVIAGIGVGFVATVVAGGFRTWLPAALRHVPIGVTVTAERGSQIVPRDQHDPSEPSRPLVR